MDLIAVFQWIRNQRWRDFTIVALVAAIFGIVLAQFFPNAGVVPLAIGVWAIVFWREWIMNSPLFRNRLFFLLVAAAVMLPLAAYDTAVAATLWVIVLLVLAALGMPQLIRMVIDRLNRP